MDLALHQLQDVLHLAGIFLDQPLPLLHERNRIIHDHSSIAWELFSIDILFRLRHKAQTMLANRKRRKD
jgi:hypothetical protein